MVMGSRGWDSPSGRRSSRTHGGRIWAERDGPGLGGPVHVHFTDGSRCGRWHWRIDLGASASTCAQYPSGMRHRDADFWRRKRLLGRPDGYIPVTPVT